MSTYIEEIAHVGGLDQLERIADTLQQMLEPANDQALTRLAAVEAILLELYPDTCARHGLTLTKSP